MKRQTQIAYGVAAACFAAILSMATTPEWWESHPFIAIMLGASMPLCVLGAWLSEFRFPERTRWGVRFVPHSPRATRIAAWCGVILGMMSLTLFLFTLSHYLAFGFAIGAILLQPFTDYQESSDKDDEPSNDASA